MFSTVTSVCFSSDLTISSPRGDLRFSVIDFLLALNWWKYQGSVSGFPGCRRRPGSPVAGFSIFTTSAPSHANDSVQDGPASNWVKSTTLTPSRQSSSTPISAIISSRYEFCRHGAPARCPSARRKWQRNGGSRLLRFARNDSSCCHCEERSDEAIPIGTRHPP